jgi:hypothetical protein
MVTRTRSAPGAFTCDTLPNIKNQPSTAPAALVQPSPSLRSGDNKNECIAANRGHERSQRLTGSPHRYGAKSSTTDLQTALFASLQAVGPSRRRRGHLLVRVGYLLQTGLLRLAIPGQWLSVRNSNSNERPATDRVDCPRYKLN